MNNNNKKKGGSGGPPPVPDAIKNKYGTIKKQAGPSTLARRGVVNPFNVRGGSGGGFHK